MSRPGESRFGKTGGHAGLECCVAFYFISITIPSGILTRGLNFKTWIRIPALMLACLFWTSDFDLSLSSLIFVPGLVKKKIKIKSYHQQQIYKSMECLIIAYLIVI